MVIKTDILYWYDDFSLSSWTWTNRPHKDGVVEHHREWATEWRMGGSGRRNRRPLPRRRSRNSTSHPHWGWQRADGITLPWEAPGICIKSWLSHTQAAWPVACHFSHSKPVSLTKWVGSDSSSTPQSSPQGRLEDERGSFSQICEAALQTRSFSGPFTMHISWVKALKSLAAKKPV